MRFEDYRARMLELEAWKRRTARRAAMMGENFRRRLGVAERLPKPWTVGLLVWVKVSGPKGRRGLELFEVWGL